MSSIPGTVLLYPYIHVPDSVREGDHALGELNDPRQLVDDQLLTGEPLRHLCTGF